MIFHDVIHGTIEFSTTDGRLVADLINCPEVQRLRHMRLLNFDVPALQELSTARRFAHAIGTCFLTARLCARSGLPKAKRDALIAAALVHDIGIPPYGHLVEASLKRLHPHFSHELIFRDIVYGTYHPTNVYHQILPGRSLQVASVLRKHGIDPAEVVEIVQPAPGSQSPICGQLDLDNIDNVHRMAALIGVEWARNNLSELTERIGLTQSAALLFDDAALEQIRLWAELRETMYSLIIAHPDCVAYNAYLHDMVEQAVDAGLISSDEWFLSDRDFEERLAISEHTSDLATQLLRGCDYTLIDYIWLHGVDGLESITQAPVATGDLPHCPVDGATYFTWFERGKIRRDVTAKFKHLGVQTFDEVSATQLVAVINPGSVTKAAVQRYEREGCGEWRRNVQATIEMKTPGTEWRAVFPESFAPLHLVPRMQAVQYELF